MSNTQKKLTAEEISQNWIKFTGLLEKLGDRAEPALDLANTFGERLCCAPASARTSFHNCFPGGLVEHSLTVLKNGFKLCKAFDWDVSKESLIIGCLFHDLGKVGDVNNDYYIPNDSQWHIDKLGELYKINEEIDYMTVPDRGIFLCQHFGLKLTRDETLAIKLNDGFILNENKNYCLKEPLLAHVVMTADYIATMQEKGAFPA